MKKDPENEQNVLLNLNQLIRKDTGLFVCMDDQGLSYSDGDAEEQYIQQVIASASDVSSLSEELRTFERDWSSECHLSSKRANVFRALDFSGVRRVLEIGSGCGAITRFLGELGVDVDAVEGSMRRAEITRQRCRDLENVQVVHADFNSLHLPEKLYDLVLFTGVLEYAGKFGKAGQHPDDALVAMLSRSMKCLAPGGALVVAIENRIGFKYLAGASEDHFSRPWVGLSQYPECADSDFVPKQGICTWDKAQWQHLLERLDGVSCQWYYPFPDYKLATSLLSEEFIQNSPSAWSCLSRIRSRDYTAVWHSPMDEQLFWQTAAAAGSLEEFANSFVLILQQKDQGRSNTALVPFDFVHFSGHNRKMKFRVKVQKNRGENRVHTTSLTEQTDAESRAVVIQHLEQESYYEGTLLAVYWCNVLRSCTSPVTVDALLQEYYHYVVSECESGKSGELLDLLPFNIVIGDDGRWYSFDQEWQTEQEVSPQFIFFRALLYFYLENKDVLRPFCKQQHLKNGWKFVEYCLSRTLYTSEFDILRFVEFENVIQEEISRPEALAPIESILDSTPDQVLNTWSWEQSSLVWGPDGKVSVPVSSSWMENGQCILFHLPPEAALSPYIQLSLGVPEHEVCSALAIHSFTMYGHQADGGGEVIFPLEGGPGLPPLMKLTGLTFFPDVMGGVFSVDDKEPHVLHFLFPEHKGKQYTSLNCEVVIEFLGKNSAQIRLDQALKEKQHLDCLLEDKRQEVVRLHQLLSEAEQSLAEIEQSRAWQAVLKMRKAQGRFSALLGKSETGVHKLQQATDTGSVESAAVEGSAAHGGEEQPELITVVLGVLDTGADELRQTVDSVLAQSYPNWELIIVDSSSADGVTLQALAECEHPRIKIHSLKFSQNLTQALDEGISLASGAWITFLGHFDRFHPDALYAVYQEICRTQADIVYCDEEVVGRYGDPVGIKTKPEFSLDALDCSDSIGATLFIRRALARQAGGFDSEFDGVQLFDLALRASLYTDKIVHLKKVLYTTRQFEPPTQDELDRVAGLSKQACAVRLEQG